MRFVLIKKKIQLMQNLPKQNNLFRLIQMIRYFNSLKKKKKKKNNLYSSKIAHNNGFCDMEQLPINCAVLVTSTTNRNVNC